MNIVHFIERKNRLPKKPLFGDHVIVTLASHAAVFFFPGLQVLCLASYIWVPFYTETQIRIFNQNRTFRFFTKIRGRKRIIDPNDPQQRQILWILFNTGYLIRTRKEKAVYTRTHQLFDCTLHCSSLRPVWTRAVD